MLTLGIDSSICNRSLINIEGAIFDKKMKSRLIETLNVNSQCKYGHKGPKYELCIDNYALQNGIAIDCTGRGGKANGEFLYVSWTISAFVLFVIASILLNTRDDRVKQLLLRSWIKLILVKMLISML